jgi:1A family penicillin-binding protein
MSHSKSRILKRILLIAAIVGAVLLLAAGIFLITLSQQLPTIDEIRNRTVTQSTKIYDRDNKTVLYEMGASSKRTVVPFADIPQSLKDATLSIEDERYYEEPAIDIKGIARAVVANLLNRKIVQGGSTITMQLARNAFLSPEQTVLRKAKEVLLAFRLSSQYSKDQILEMYLNEIPYGATIYGVETAARSYFGKSVKDLDIAESAILASIPKAPPYYSPWSTHRKELLVRQKLVLKKMRELNKITEEQYQSALKEKLTFLPQSEGILAPHFSLMVQDYLVDKYGDEVVRKGGLKVTTSLDWEMQLAAEKAVKEGAGKNTKLYQGHNAALVALNPKNGQVLALVGSRDYFDVAEEGNFNVAVQGLRQPGSSLKPFVYLTAFQKGFTPDTVLYDVPTEFVSGNANCPLIPPFNDENNSCFHPENYDHQFRGPVSMRNALAQSLNIPAVKTLYLAGMNDVIANAQKFGLSTLTDPKRYGLSLVLGGGAVRLYDLVQGYSVLAADGIRHPANFVLEVKDKDGNTLEKAEPQEQEVADAQSVRMVNAILSDGEARKPLFSGSYNLTTLPDRQNALKTGTSNDYRDAWVIGYTPELVAGVWAGNNNNQPMVKQGGSILAAVPIWSSFMNAVIQKFPATAFVAPDSYVRGKPILDGNPSPDGQIHTILNYVSKADPLGAAPANPSTDPQFFNWEAGVLAWAGRNIDFLKTITQSSTIQTASTSISFESPLDGAYVNSPLQIRATINSGESLNAVRLLLNNQPAAEVRNITVFPYIFQWSLAAPLDPQNTISLETETASGKKKIQDIIVYSQNSQ